MLYIVATPIGNLSDITLRALEVLKSVDLIACEDTRQTQKLLSHYQIHKPLTSYYEHNKLQKGEHLLKLLKEGKSIALVSDSGTPAISDLGFHIVKLALENNICVSPIPGASALTAALSACGIPANRFVFEGFLPIKPGARKKKLTGLLSQDKTAVLYESPYRILRLLDMIKEISPEAQLTVVREVTKKFEEIKSGCIEPILDYYKSNPGKVKGEFVVVLNVTPK
jgi:16S rRNA (cytidine1402-2'-O)-methyltransferase